MKCIRIRLISSCRFPTKQPFRQPAMQPAGEHIRSQRATGRRVRGRGASIQIEIQQMNALKQSFNLVLGVYAPLPETPSLRILTLPNLADLPMLPRLGHVVLEICFFQPLFDVSMPPCPQNIYIRISDLLKSSWKYL